MHYLSIAIYQTDDPDQMTVAVLITIPSDSMHMETVGVGRGPPGP